MMTKIMVLTAERVHQAGVAFAEGFMGAIESSTPWPNPGAVEIGQLWIAPCMAATNHDLTPIRVQESRGPHVIFDAPGVFGSASVMLAPSSGWRCVGYQLDDGRRVMVGELWTRDPDEAPFIVHSIEIGGRIRLERADGSAGVTRAAEYMLGGHQSTWRRVRLADAEAKADLRDNLGDEFNYGEGLSRQLLHEPGADDVRPTLGGITRLFRAVASDECERAIARRRVDAAIAVYRGPFAQAVGAGLRAACEDSDLSQHQVTATIGAMMAYEEHRPGAKVLTWQERSVCRSAAICSWDTVPAWLLVTLDVYERERGR